MSWMFVLISCLVQGAFEGLEADDDEDFEIETMTQDYTKRGGKIIG